MVNYFWAAVVVAVAMFTASGSVLSNSHAQILFRFAGCRHHDDATSLDRARRAQALALARAINAAQGLVAQETRLYQTLAKLRNLPQIPEGFRVRLYTDGTAYIFSIKDERDPCHYGIFSDQEGRLYEMTPSVPLIAS